jgi:plastocyanin
MKKLIAGATAAALAAGALAATAFGATKTITVKDNVFSPTTVTVKKGTTVKWVWKGKAPHNVISTGAGKFQSKTQVKGSFSKKLTKAGTYKIVCSIHQPGMKMTLKVR